MQLLKVPEFPLRLVNAFNVADNPVLTLASFLVGLVDPKVAQAAAKAAVDKLTEKTMNSMTAKAELQKTGATALAAAAAKAHGLATVEELQMQKLTRTLIETQLKKMELKLTRFQEFEQVLENERKELEAERSKLVMERLEFKQLKAGQDVGVQEQNGNIVREVEMEEDIQLQGAKIVTLQ
jgi:SWI/SNF related-matrix-associated actin-dependent regulator of chromatin subfamily C